MMPSRWFLGMFTIRNGGFSVQILSNETQGAGMVFIASPAQYVRRSSVGSPGATNLVGKYSVLLGFLFLCVAVLGSGGCGQTAKPVVSPATGQVDSYFGGPFLVTGSTVSQSAAAFDHSANQIVVSGQITNNRSTSGAQVPVDLINGTFASAATGFLAVTENFATTSNGIPSAQNPALTGAWA